MLSDFISALVSLAVWVAVLWGLVALASLKFRPLVRVRRTMTRLILASIAGVGHLIWLGFLALWSFLSPRHERNGPVHMHNPGRVSHSGEESEEW